MKKAMKKTALGVALQVLVVVLSLVFLLNPIQVLAANVQWKLPTGGTPHNDILRGTGLVSRGTVATVENQPDNAFKVTAFDALQATEEELSRVYIRLDERLQGLVNRVYLERDGAKETDPKTVIEFEQVLANTVLDPYQSEAEPLDPYAGSDDLIYRIPRLGAKGLFDDAINEPKDGVRYADFVIELIVPVEQVYTALGLTDESTDLPTVSLRMHGEKDGKPTFTVNSDVTTDLLGKTNALVIFDRNFGDISKQDYVRVERDKVIGNDMPRDPARSGYAFAGWYTDKNAASAPFDPANAVAEDLLLYAAWTQPLKVEPVADIEVIENNAIPTVQLKANREADFVAVYALPDVVFNESNATFSGVVRKLNDWDAEEYTRPFKVTYQATSGNETAEGTFNIIVLRDADNNGIADIEEQGTEQKLASVSLYPNTELQKKPDVRKFLTGTKIYAMLPQLRRSGYTFTGWNTEADGSGLVIDEDFVLKGDLDLFAQWKVGETDPTDPNTNPSVNPGDRPSSPTLNPISAGDTLISGKADPGTTVKVYNKDDVLIGEGVTGPTGIFAAKVDPSKYSAYEVLSFVAYNDAGVASKMTRAIVRRGSTTNNPNNNTYNRYPNYNNRVTRPTGRQTVARTGEYHGAYTASGIAALAVVAFAAVLRIKLKSAKDNK